MNTKKPKALFFCLAPILGLVACGPSVEPPVASLLVEPAGLQFAFFPVSSISS